MNMSRAFSWVISTVFFVTLTSACQSGTVRSVAPKEAAQLVEQNKAYLVDVREAGELAESGTAQGALWIPTSVMDPNSPEMKAFVQSISPDGSKDKEVILFCRSGARAGRVAPMLEKMGFKVANMGGFADWASAGLPVVRK